MHPTPAEPDTGDPIPDPEIQPSKRFSIIWLIPLLAAVIGIACGAAQWPLVVIAAVISLLVLTLLRLVEPKDKDRKLGGKDE